MPTDPITTQPLKTNRLVKVAFSLGALVLLGAHTHWPDFVPDDKITLGLLIAMILPWVPSFLDSAELPGGWKFQFKQLEEEQEHQRQEIESLKFLMTGFVTGYELLHLEKLARNEEFPYEKSEPFVAELRRLRALGLIANYASYGITGMPSEGKLKDYFYITERGKTYLMLRAQWDDKNPDGKPV